MMNPLPATLLRISDRGEIKLELNNLIIDYPYIYVLLHCNII